MASVHLPVLERTAPPIYVSRREPDTLFIAGPNFTDDEPTCFGSVPLAQAIELDPSLTELATLAVGRCAWRHDPTAPWSYGLIPVGTIFLLSYEARPAESHPESEEIDGAIVNCWVVAAELETAQLLAEDSLAEYGWRIVERKRAVTATLSGDESDRYFRQAQIDGLTIVEYRFPREEPESD